MKIIESQLSFKGQTLIISEKERNLARLHQILAPYPILINLLNIKNLFTPSTINPMCFICLSASKATLRLAEKDHVLTSGSIITRPPSEELHFRGSVELLCLADLGDLRAREMEVLNIATAPKYFYSSRAVTLQRIDDENIMILSQHFHFSIILNLKTLDFRVLGETT